MNYITIKNLRVFACHGVFPEEQKIGQPFFISAKLYLDTGSAAREDSLETSVDYGEVCHFLTSLMTEKTFRLIEAAAEYLAQNLLWKYPLIHAVELSLSKPNAPVNLPFEDISITVKRSWHNVYLGIGSNMGNRKEYLDFAVAKLNGDKSCIVSKVSSYVVTKPYGGVEQEDFLNGAVYIRTIYSPHELLCFLHEIENNAGRKRLVHWGPRTLDLDILLYDSLILEDPDLIIPHPDMENREFVLKPLCEIAPFKLHPVLLKRIRDIKA